MDWRQFVSQVIGHTAWPLVALVFLALFRSEIRKIVSRLIRLRYKDLELDFDRIKQKTRSLYLEAQRAGRLTNAALVSLGAQILEAADKSPTASILLAWTGIESAMASAVAKMDLALKALHIDLLCTT